MHHMKEMIATHPDVKGSTNDALIRCLEECYSCAQTCTSCADACLAEEMVAQLRQCIRLNLDCADICLTTGKVLSRHTGYDANLTRAVIDACRTACKACAATTPCITGTSSSRSTTAFARPGTAGTG